MMRTDYHIHTYFCKHATGEIAEYLDFARKLGLTEICFTDHAPSFGGYDQKHRMDPDRFQCYRDLIRDLRKSNKNPRVLYGIEADFYDGCETFLRPWLAQQDFDLVIGSVHYIKNWGFDNPDERRIWDSADINSTWQTYFDLLVKLVDTGLYDIMGHLDLPKKFGHRLDAGKLKEFIKPVLDRIATAGMAVEINTSGLRKIVGEIYPSLEILQMTRERDIPICFGSDAHQPDEVGYAFDEAIKLAKKAGYTHSVRFNQRKKQNIPLP